MINMELFHFLRPEWLLALIPLAALIIAISVLHKQQSGWQSVLAGHLYQHLISSKNNRKSRPPLSLLALGWLLAVLALAGPTWEQLPQPVYQLNTGKVVVMDMSLSMRATDVTPNRLTRAKYKAIDLINEIAEGETGLVAYAGDAFTISPLSSDGQNLTALVPSLAPEIMPVAGSEPILGLESAAELLQNAGFQQGEIFWVTDGIEAAQVEEIRTFLSGIPYRLSILAVGTEEGAPIQLVNGELMKDSRGAIVVPKLSFSSLQTLSSASGGRFAPMQANDSDIQYLTSQTLTDRDTQDQQDEQNEVGDEWKEMGPYLLLLLLPIAAYSFRRGLISLLLLGVLMPGFAPSAQANWWQDMWQTGDQQGMQSFSKDQFESAATKFNDPMWKGSALYKAGDYESALNAFSQLDTTDALYNQGNSLAQLGELEQAIATYEAVLNRDPEHEDAKANKELLEQLKQQQEQEQQQEQQQDDQNQQNDQDQQEQDKQQQQQEQDQQDEQQQQDQQSSQDESNNSEQQQPQESEQQPQESEEEEKEQESEQQEPQQQEQQKGEEQQPQQAEERELTDEEKEQMQRLQNLLRKVPDDPAYLLKRKMLWEHQQRRRERAPTQKQRNW